MKQRITIGWLFFLAVTFAYGQVQDVRTLPTPQENRKPKNYQAPRYIYSLEELKNNFSEEMMQRAHKQYQKVQVTNHNGQWKPTPESIDAHQVPEWFKDAKFGMFIDWGLWSVAGWAPKKEGAMYPDWYEFRMDTDTSFMQYHEKNWGKDFKRDDFIPLFRAENYQPEQLVAIAKGAGMKYIVPFTKHHSGFCLWPSSYTQRDAMDMGPNKDLIKPLVEHCKKEGLKFGFYFSVEEWEYPVIGSTGQLQNRLWSGEIKQFDASLEKKCSGKIAVRNFGTDYLVPQATEFIDQYDPDLIWFDGDWNTHVEELHTYDIASYFYNKNEGRKPVAVNDRYGPHAGEKWQRSKRGDFYTNEYGDMEKEVKQARHAWEECRGISQSFGYNWQDTDGNVISSKKFIEQFVDIVSHGGNLLLIVNLDGKGALPNIQETRLRDIGQWLKVNGEGIYATRPYKQPSEGSVSYTQSKDERSVYAIMKEWPGNELHLKGVNPAKGSKIELLGYTNSLEWVNSTEGVTVKLPVQLQTEKNRPCQYAWVLKINQ